MQFVYGYLIWRNYSYAVVCNKGKNEEKKYLDKNTMDITDEQDGKEQRETNCSYKLRLKFE